MSITLTSLHYIYIVFILIILIAMMLKKDITFICILGIFILGLDATNSITAATSGVFNSFILAITELLSTILIISVITSMGIVLNKTGINDTLAYPFTKIMKTPALSYWTIGIFTLIISLLFWPSPAIALIGAILVPAAVKSGLPPIGAAMAMNLFGHGIALSGDFIIQGAPKLTADGAGIPVGNVILASIPLVTIIGLTTTIIAFIALKKDMKSKKISFKEDFNVTEKKDEKYKDLLSLKSKKMFSFLIMCIFILDIFVMYKLNLQGGDATALIGGTALIILITITLYVKGENASSSITSCIVEGFIFGFKVFGPVIPIAAFFYMGSSGFTTVFGEILPKGSSGLVNDLGIVLANLVPINPLIASVTLTTVGGITGLDGSGFSGISLAGSIAKIFGIALGKGTETLTALGQISAIWVGGGTLIPWALIPVAAICKVEPFELAKRNLKPVIIGLLITTILATFLI